MKKIPGWFIALVVIALLIGSKFLFFSKKDESSAQAAKGKSGAPLAATYVLAKPQSLKNNVYSSGKIGAFNEVDIMPEVSGKLSAIYFKEGEHVSKGTLLAKINDADLQAQLLKNKTQLKLSEEKLDRAKKLLDIKGLSQEEYDMQAAEVNTLKADQQFISAQLSKTSLVAPFDGVVGLRNVSEGAYVNSSTVIASLVQLKPLFVEFSVPERYSSTLKKDMAIKFSYENTGTTKEYEAHIYAIEPKVDEFTKTVKCRALYKGDQPLFPGSFVKVFVELSDIANAIMIPTQSIIPVLKGQKVIISKNGMAEERMVITGIRTDVQIQIIEGLSEGDTVLTSGLLAAKPGTKLKLINQGK
jgi:membrane fusion protein (multidrug efflux system)